MKILKTKITLMVKYMTIGLKMSKIPERSKGQALTDESNDDVIMLKKNKLEKHIFLNIFKI